MLQVVVGGGVSSGQVTDVVGYFLGYYLYDVCELLGVIFILSVC